MLAGGEHPEYVARRMVRMAVEDIGLADPQALTNCIAAWQAYERLGSPEGELALAQAVVYLACAPKSNAAYAAYQAAARDARELGSLEVPARLRNAPTGLMKALGHGAGYRYAHDEPDAHAAGERYFPDDMPPATYYHPVPRGLEQKIGEKLERLRQANRAARGDAHDD
jgi:putative ATPase